MIGKTDIEGFESLILESDTLWALVIPELGGKIASLVDKASGFDFAYRNPRTGLVKYPYDAPYLTSDSGIGDLFPCIGTGTYPRHPWKGVPLPDKGEIWTQAMTARLDGEAIELGCAGLRFPYSYRKRIELRGDRLELAFEIVNRSDFAFEYLWSLQPHLKIEGRMRIDAPKETDFLVDWSASGGFEEGRRYRWPRAESGPDRLVRDFSIIDAIDGEAEKLYLADLERGEIGLDYLDLGLRLEFLFDSRQLPHCGLWINKEGWPLEGDRTRLLAIQPCSCLSDFADRSESLGASSAIPARGKREYRAAIAIDRRGAARRRPA